jgi:GNAT superfamily N-acetyltransferase
VEVRPSLFKEHKIKIQRVKSKADLKQFIELPYHHYRQDPLWVPPLRDEQRGQFAPERNPLLDHCQYELFLLLEGKRAIGRIAAFIDHLALEFWGEQVGLFGYYESPDDEAAAKLLLETAADWLRMQGMQFMRGPWTFVSQEWGLVIEGFSPPPTIMAPYNPRYYIEQLEGFGLRKTKDLLCYSVSAADGYRIPARILTLTDAVAKRYGVKVRQVDMRRYDQEVETIVDLSNQSLADNWGYAPVTEAEAQAMARDLKPVIQPKAVVIAEDSGGRPIGFAIALPNVNELLRGLNGRLLPFGWMKLLYGLPRLRSYRMFALGVIPEYHGRGVDSLIYRKLYESLNAPDIWLEINYVLEDNIPMNNAIRKLEASPLRRYRIYQKEL